MNQARWLCSPHLSRGRRNVGAKQFGEHPWRRKPEFRASNGKYRAFSGLRTAPLMAPDPSSTVSRPRIAPIVDGRVSIRAEGQSRRFEISDHPGNDEINCQSQFHPPPTLPLPLGLYNPSSREEEPPLTRLLPQQLAPRISCARCRPPPLPPLSYHPLASVNYKAQGLPETSGHRVTPVSSSFFRQA